MAPPHTTAKTTTSAQSTSRRGAHELRKRVVEQAEEEFIASGEDDAHEIDADETEALDNSQSTNNGSLQKLMADIVDSQRKRHQIRKQGVHKAYTKAHAETQGAIISLFDEHEVKASEAYSAQLRRLRDLIKQKAAVEKAMAKKVAALRSDYDVHSDTLRKIIEYRLKELR